MPYIFDSRELAMMLAAFVALAVSWLSWRKRSTAPEATPFALLMGAVFIWGFGGAFELAAQIVELKIFWSQVTYIGIVYTPPAWFVFALRYGRMPRHSTAKLPVLVSVVPTVILLLALSNEWHHLLWRSVTLFQSEMGILARYERGPVFWTNVVYSYSLLVAGTGLLIRTAIESSRLFRLQAAALLLATIIPWVANFLYVARIGPTAGYDFTPFAFTVTGILLFLGIFSFRLLELSPVATDALYKNMRDGVVVTNSQGRIVSCNPSAYELFGVARTVIGTRLLDSIPALASTEVRPETGEQEIELEANGGQRWLGVHATEIGVAGRLYVMRDITPRKAMEQQLLSSRRLEEALLNAPIDAAFLIGPDGTVLAANKAGATRLGMTVQELIGKNLREFFPKHLVESRAQRLREVLLYKKPVQFIDERAGRVTSNSLYPIVDGEGNVTHIAVYARDITDIRKKERELAGMLLKMKELEAIINRSKAIVIRRRAQPDHLIEYVTENINQLGYTADDFISGRIRWINVVHPDDVVRQTRELEEYSRKGVKEFSTEFRLFDSQGGVRWMNDRTRAIADDTGKITHYESVMWDVTDPKRTEQALRNAQKMESLGVLAGGIAHDFNNVLQGIFGQASLALTRLEAHHPAYQSVHKLEVASLRAAELTRQLLAYSGRALFHLTPLSLNDVIAENMDVLRNSVTGTVDFTFSLDPSLEPVNADAGQVGQLLKNIVINSGEAIGERRGTIDIKTKMTDLTEEGAARWSRGGDKVPPGRFAVLEVADNGCGMSDETLEKIFDPFYSTKYIGRGLGLAAVLGIVRGHKGAIQVTSRLGEGSTFRIIFPVLREIGQLKSESASPQPREPRTRQSNEAPAILVIDDEEAVRDIVKEILESSGYTVIIASSGEQGLELFRQHETSIALALVDLSMPGIGGEETLRRLRSLSPSLLIILSSGYSESEVAERFPTEKPDAFIQKPYKPAALLELIRSLTS